MPALRARRPMHCILKRARASPSQDVPITQLHKPFISVERPAADAPRKWANHPLTRLAVGAAVAGLLYVLYSHAPDKGEPQAGAAGCR